MIYSRINTLGRQMICRRPASTLLALALMIVSTDPQTIVAQVGDKAAQEVPSLIEIPTASGEAYVEYLRGLELLGDQGVSVASANYDSDGISEHFLRATELDPNFLAAWLRIMEVSSAAVFFNRDPDGTHMQYVRDALVRILDLAPDSPESDLANGIYHYYVERDLEAAFVELERAAAARPNDIQTLQFLARVARRLQQWDADASAMGRLILLDPGNQLLRRQQINHLQDSTDYGAAIVAAADAMQRFPDEVLFRVRHAVLVARKTGDVTLCTRLVEEVPPKDLIQNGFRWAALYPGVFPDIEQAVAWIEAANPDSHSDGFIHTGNDYLDGLLLSVEGNSEAAELRFKAAYAREIARSDGATEEFRLRRMGWRSLIAALAGEREEALEYRRLALDYADTTDDLLYGNSSRRNAAYALAILGDVDEAWLELESLISAPRGLTEWDLVLWYDTSHIFADSRGYQARISQLEKAEPIDSLSTQNLTALEAYSRGVENYEQQTASGVAEGVEHFEEAISLDPDFAKAHAMLGRLLLMQSGYAGLPRDSQIAKAEPHILRALELDDTECEAYSALAYLRRMQGDYDAAQLAYKRAIELDPNNAVALKTYATFLTYYRLDVPEAARMLRKAYEVDPTNKQAPDRLARSVELSGQLDEAQKLRESTAAKNPTDGSAHILLGEFYHNYIGQFDDAIVAFRDAYALEPNGPETVGGISDAYFCLADREQTVFWGKRVVRMLQDSSQQTRWRTWILKIEGDDAAREKQALEGLKESPRSGSLLWHLTDIDIASGHPEKSRSRWELAYPSLFEPSAAIYVRNVWRAKDLARVLMATGEREQANVLITGALTTAKSMVTTLYTLRLQAELYAIAGEEEQTLAAIDRFLEAGGSPYDLMMQDPLKPFQDNPKYQEMAAKREAELVVQLKRIREMEANGELAPIPDQ